MKFTSERGHTPQAEARRHVYRILVPMLQHELTDPDGWMFGGIAEEPDKRRLTKAIKAVAVEMARRAVRP